MLDPQTTKEPDKSEVQKILLLGLGGGSIAKAINFHHWNNIRCGWYIFSYRDWLWRFCSLYEQRHSRLGLLSRSLLNDNGCSIMPIANMVD